jgi:DNA invertase Pin-like site-specific DNA recombinase
MVAETHLNHPRTRKGIAKARANGRFNGKQPKLPLTPRKTIYSRYHNLADDTILADLAEEYSVGRSTIHCIISRTAA